MYKVIGSLAALVFLLALSLPAGAQQTRFDALDTDNDGYLNQEEVQAGFPNADQATFQNMDSDGDGRLTHQEWADNRNCLGLGQGYGGGGQGQGMGQGMGQGKGKGNN